MPTNKSIDQALSAAEHPILLESVAQLKAAASEWNQSEILGVDTEFVRERTYRADLGLVQVSDGTTAWLVDPVRIDSLDELTLLMDRKELVKILHSGSEDLEVLFNDLGTLPTPLIDTQIACALLGRPLQMGYHHAVKWLLDVDVDKDQTRSNWLRRPLTPNQLRYAAIDVVLLPMMYRILRQRLIDAGRLEWLDEEVERMKRVSMTPVEPETAYLRFKRTGHLDPSEMRVLQALAQWREVVAREKNLARGFVISDAALMKLVQSKPNQIAQMKEIDELHPQALSRYGQDLVTLIAQADSSEITVDKVEELSNGQKKQLDRMRQRIRSTAQALDLDPALLASKRELEKLVRSMAADAPPPERFLGWRKNIITDELVTL